MTQELPSPLAGVRDEDLIAEVNSRLQSGDIDADDLDIDDEDGGDSIYFQLGIGQGGVCDMHALEEAAARFRRREYREMLWHLEKALGSDFAGLSDLKSEQFS